MPLHTMAGVKPSGFSHLLSHGTLAQAIHNTSETNDYNAKRGIGVLIPDKHGVGSGIARSSSKPGPPLLLPHTHGSLYNENNFRISSHDPVTSSVYQPKPLTESTKRSPPQ
jgi:hypothetical protein